MADLTAPYRCILCKFEVSLDDAIAPLIATGRCICLRCFSRETSTTHPMPDGLRKAVTAAAQEET